MGRIRRGYKQTEIGEIPEDWEVSTLESTTYGEYGIVDGPFGSNLKTIHYKRSGIPVISSGYVTQGIFIATDYIYVDVEKFKQEKRSAVRGGDIVMAKIGARCGASAIMPLNHETSILSGNALKITIDNSRHSTSFIWQILWDMYAQGEMEKLKTIGAQPALSIKNLKKLLIPLPPLDEQRRIAEALSDADAQIMALAELIAKKRDIKHGTMQRLLTGQERLAGFSGEWEVKQLRQLCNAIIDGTHYTPTYVANGIPFYSVENVVANDFINTKFISQEEHLILTRKYKPQKGDILLTRIGSLGVTKLIDWDIEASIYVSLALLRLNESVSSTYLYSYTKSKQFIKDMESHSLMNATPKKINMGEIGNIPIPIPPLDEQIAIARVLSDMDADIEALQTEHDKWVMIKQGMIHELLTGKVRL